MNIIAKQESPRHGVIYYEAPDYPRWIATVDTQIVPLEVVRAAIEAHIAAGANRTI